MTDDKKLTLLGHLKELRQRLLKSVIAVAITTVISFFFFEHILNFLKVPAGNIELIFIEMTEGLGTYMRVCLVSGIILAMPYLMYHFLMFVTPALTRREKKMVFLILPWIILMFVGGIYFGYQYLIPPATKFLLSFGAEIAEPQIRIGNYVTFVARLLLAIGLAFELPVVTTFLARIGVISSKWLADRRRVMIIFAFILGAIITPTIDPINQSIVAGTLILLYEMSIWLAKLVQRKEPREVVPVPSPASHE
ncbi:MAG: twin-arginine translocase subunit TatC [Dehalococcoidales bacterium]|nr:twin-arginine translocase subunit TatC [Dehalococcoidales bacterium]